MGEEEGTLAFKAGRLPIANGRYETPPAGREVVGQESVWTHIHARVCAVLLFGQVRNHTCTRPGAFWCSDDIQVRSRVSCLTRVFHMFESADGKLVDTSTANDVSTTVSLHVSKGLKKIFALPVIHVSYSWSQEMMQAMVVFSKWPSDKVRPCHVWVTLRSRL